MPTTVGHGSSRQASTAPVSVRCFLRAGPLGTSGPELVLPLAPPPEEAVPAGLKPVCFIGTSRFAVCLPSSYTADNLWLCLLPALLRWSYG